MHMPNKQDFIRLDRRKFLAVAAGLVAAGALPKGVLALAGPSSFKHGAFDLTVVSDGTVTLPLSVVNPNARPEDLKVLLGASVKGDGHMAELNVVLAKSGNDVILFDTGTGANPGTWPDGGQLAASLGAAGLSPADVTTVIYTHAHPDHLFGTFTAEGQLLFPNATYHMAEAEYDFWSMPSLAAQVPPDLKPIVDATQQMLPALQEKLSTFRPGEEVLPGIGVIDTAGHTPGHVSFELAGGDGMILVGDAITVPAVFFREPEAAFGFDQDGQMAAKSRRALLEYAAKGKKKMLGYHWAYPGLGMAEARGTAFAQVSVPGDV